MRRYVLAAVILGAGCVNVAVGQPQDEAGEAVPAKQIRALMDEARAATLRNDMVAAEKIFDQLIDVVRQRYATGNVDGATSIASQILQLDARYAPAHFMLAEIYRQINKPMWAVEHYNRYLETNRNDPAAVLGLGVCYYMREHYTLAIRNLRRLVEELDPNNVYGLRTLGLAMALRAEQKGRDVQMYRQGVAYMNKAVRLASQATDEETRAMLGNLQYSLAELSFGYQQLLEQGRGGEDYGIPLNQYRLALRTLSERLERDPTDGQALDEMMLCYAGMKKVRGAQSRRNPNNAQLYVAMAELVDAETALMAHRTRIVVLGYLRKAVEVDPNGAALRIGLAQRGYRALGMITEAIAEVDEAIKLAPQNREDYEAIRKALVATTQPGTK